MKPFRVECLACGARRVVATQEAERHADPGECHRCGYVGWASCDELTATSRRQLRERPLGSRGLRLATS